MEIGKEHTHELKSYPIIIGNYLPFRLVLLEADTWSPTMDNINNNTYDYVKLHRLSTAIDIGISPYSLFIGFDGSLILPALPKYLKEEKVIEEFNKMLGIMLLGGIYSEAISPLDILTGSLTRAGYFKSSNSGHGANTRFHHDIHSTIAGISDRMRLINPEIISAKELENAYNKGKIIYSKLRPFSSSLLLNGISHFVKNQMIEALITLWTSIEQLVNIIWVNEIIKKASNNKIEGRSKFLEDSRTWTASAKIEMLFQKNYISDNEYKLLNVGRKSRNELIHEGTIPNLEVIEKVLDVIFKIISLIISEYTDKEILKEAFLTIIKNKRGLLASERIKIEPEKSYYVLDPPPPPIPGEKNWKGDYEKLKGFSLGETGEI